MAKSSRPALKDIQVVVRVTDEEVKKIEATRKPKIKKAS